MTVAEAINKVLTIAENEVGYLEKKSNASLYDKTANAGSANYTKYWAEIKPSYQGQPWCACFVTWCFVKAFGREYAERLLRHYPYVYCPDMQKLFTLHANPKVGDIVIFYRNGTFAHTGIVASVSGDYFTTIEGNTSGASGIIANGGGTCKKSYYNSKLPGTKFITPDYKMLESEEKLTMEQYNELKKLISAQNAEITELKKQNEKLANAIGGTFIYNYIDNNMPEWAREDVQWCIDNHILEGTGEGLNLNGIKIWTLVVVRRAVKLVCKMINIKI